MEEKKLIFRMLNMYLGMEEYKKLNRIQYCRFIDALNEGNVYIKFDHYYDIIMQKIKSHEKNYYRKLDVYEIFELFGAEVTKIAKYDIYIHKTADIKEYLYYRNNNYCRNTDIRKIELENKCVNIYELMEYMRYINKKSITLEELINYLQIDIIAKDKTLSQYKNKKLKKVELHFFLRSIARTEDITHDAYITNLGMLYLIKNYFDQEHINTLGHINKSQQLKYF